VPDTQLAEFGDYLTAADCLVASDQFDVRLSGTVLLIGTRLLTPRLLMIDFAANIVEIETQA
jgi:hypothetical protein